MVAYNTIMSTFTKTSSIKEFAMEFGIKQINQEFLANGKSFFKTDNGIEGKIGEEASPMLEIGDFSSLRISWCVQDEGSKYKDCWMIHKSSDKNEVVKSITFVF